VFELVRTSDLYASVTYQPLLQGSASGVVWIIRAGGDTETVPRNAICLCEEIPNELPPVRALVTNALQMPLAHTALLCANRRTPNLGLPGSEFQNLVRFEGRRVRLTVGASAYSIEPLEGTDDEEEPPLHAKIEIPPPSKGPLKLIHLAPSTPLSLGMVRVSRDLQAACGAKGERLRTTPALRGSPNHPSRRQGCGRALADSDSRQRCGAVRICRGPRGGVRQARGWRNPTRTRERVAGS